MTDTPTSPRKGLLVDFGGVLTADIFASFQAFCTAEGIETDAVRKLFLEDPQAFALLSDFECGRMSEDEFEPRFAAMLGVAEHDRLIDRLFAGMHPDEEMLAAVRAARCQGVRTGLLSNSWGAGRYDRGLFGELFDGTVISGEVGIRKPDPEIYAMAADAIGLPAAECVFVDDLPGNLKPARELGMATVHHTAAALTIAELERLLGVQLR